MSGNDSSLREMLNDWSPQMMPMRRSRKRAIKDELREFCMRSDGTSSRSKEGHNKVPRTIEKRPSEEEILFEKRKLEELRRFTKSKTEPVGTPAIAAMKSKEERLFRIRHLTKSGQTGLENQFPEVAKLAAETRLSAAKAANKSRNATPKEVLLSPKTSDQSYNKIRLTKMKALLKPSTDPELQSLVVAELAKGGVAPPEDVVTSAFEKFSDPTETVESHSEHQRILVAANHVEIQILKKKQRLWEAQIVAQAEMRPRIARHGKYLELEAPRKRDDTPLSILIPSKNEQIDLVKEILLQYNGFSVRSFNFSGQLEGPEAFTVASFKSTLDGWDAAGHLKNQLGVKNIVRQNSTTPPNSTR